MDLEKSLAELEKIVKKLDSGELTLDQSLKEYEKGAKLIKECTKYLEEAKLKITTLKEEMKDE